MNFIFQANWSEFLNPCSKWQSSIRKDKTWSILIILIRPPRLTAVSLATHVNYWTACLLLKPLHNITWSMIDSCLIANHTKLLHSISTPQHFCACPKKEFTVQCLTLVAYSPYNWFVRKSRFLINVPLNVCLLNYFLFVKQAFIHVDTMQHYILLCILT